MNLAKKFDDEEVATTTELFTEAAMLMATGMGFVFAFLSLLIVTIKFLIAPLAKRFPDEIPKQSQPNNPQIEPKVVAAISAAIKQYRQQHPPESN